MKKRIILLGISMMLGMLCGCLEATPLTDSEMDVVAEYAATLLLKHDTKYVTPLYYAETSEEMEKLLTPTPTPTPTEVPTPTPVVGNNNASGNSSVTGQPTLTPTPTPPMYNDEETGKQLTEIIAVEDITVTCENFKLMDSVVSNEYFALAAKKGRQYAVVSFKLHNETDQEIIFDASEKGLEYSIDVNTGTVSKVSLSMLENDLQYMPIAVPANGTADAVLVFEIDKVEINTAHLIIQGESEQVVFIKMQ